MIAVGTLGVHDESSLRGADRGVCRELTTDTEYESSSNRPKQQCGLILKLRVVGTTIEI